MNEQFEEKRFLEAKQEIQEKRIQEEQKQALKADATAEEEEKVPEEGEKPPT